MQAKSNESITQNGGISFNNQVNRKIGHFDCAGESFMGFNPKLLLHTSTYPRPLAAVYVILVGNFVDTCQRLVTDLSETC